MKTVQQLSLAKAMLEDRTSARTSKTPDTNCPNCGAPRHGWSCEYCGTVFISDYREEACLETQRKLWGTLAAIKNAEMERQMIQNIVPYRFNPMASASQCCCSIQDSMQQQYDSQQCSILDNALIRNPILTPNEMRNIFGFELPNTFY